MSASKEGIMPSFFAGAPTSSPLYQRSQIAGPIPREDGDLNWYNVPMPPPHGRPIMFVNGVNTSAIGHAQAAQSLCQITRGRVLAQRVGKHVCRDELRRDSDPGLRFR